MKKIIILLTTFLLIGCSQNQIPNTEDDFNKQLTILSEDVKLMRDEILQLEKDNKALKLELNSLVDKQSSYESNIEFNASGIDDQKESARWLTTSILRFNSLVSNLDGYYESYGYISEIDFEENELTVDLTNFVTINDIELIKDLNLDVDNDFPNGFCIHNPVEDITKLKIDNETTYIRIMYDNDLKQGIVDIQEFIESLDYKVKYYKLSIYKGKVLQVTEFYIP